MLRYLNWEKCQSHSLCLHIEEYVSSARKQMAPLLQFQIFYLSSRIAADDVDAEAMFCPKGHWCNQHSISTNSAFAVRHWAVSHSARSEQISNTSELGMVAFIVKCYLCTKTEPDWTGHFNERRMQPCTLIDAKAGTGTCILNDFPYCSSFLLSLVMLHSSYFYTCFWQSVSLYVSLTL